MLDSDLAFRNLFLEVSDSSNDGVHSSREFLLNLETNRFGRSKATWMFFVPLLVGVGIEAKKDGWPIAGIVKNLHHAFVFTGVALVLMFVALNHENV